MRRKLITRLLAIRRWINPSYELARLARLARHGTISVEKLLAASVSKGRLRPLARELARTLLDLKQQRAERAALQQEIRDRIANRTDALERKIGSLTVQATRDALTGLGNRRGLDLDLPKVIENHLLDQADLCLLMMDVDHFKPLNDTLGHVAGDQLLREIGQLIRSTLRGNDQAYRCGGDEFVALLHERDTAAGRSIAVRLEWLVKELTRHLKVPFPPQLSIGVCALSELPDPTAKELLHTADMRLYEVKATRPRTRRSA